MIGARLLELRRPPNRRARWAAAHPLLGAVVIGLGWGAFMAVWGILTAHDTTAVPIALAFGVCLFGPVMVWIMRRGMLRWDAEHPTG